MTGISSASKCVLRASAILAAAALASALRAAPPAEASLLQPQAVLNQLNEVILWYRQTEAGSQWVGQPSDASYLDAQRLIAANVVRKAFESADADIPLFPPIAAPAAGQTATAQETRARIRADAVARSGDLLNRIGELNLHLSTAPAADRTTLAAERGELQAELEMAQTTLSRIDDIESFAATSAGDLGTAGIAEQINDLKRSIPEALAPEGAATSAAAPPRTIGLANGGLISRGEALFSLFGAIASIDRLDHATTGLEKSSETLSQPLRAAIQQVMQEGDGIESQTRAAGDVAALDAARIRLQSLDAQLKRLSNAVVPLGEERSLLRQTHDNLRQWRESLMRQERLIVRGLLERAIVLVFVLGLGVLASEFTRRATYKYVHEHRRRRQLLVLRRFGLGFFIALVVILNLVSDFSSLATYVGLITAGVAVALQTVILSVAAYFLLIGRYGVRAGDRISVMGVTGEVIEVGLVRFYLTELAGTGVDLHPTGRIVVFPNAALFQNAPFFKQLPGTDYTWHEAVVALTPVADTGQVQPKLLAAVNTVYAKYRPALEQQHGMVERLIDLHLEVPQPSAQVRYTAEGVHLVLRYPVELRHADEIDSATIFALMAAIRQDPLLKEAVTGTPRVQAAVPV